MIRGGKQTQLTNYSNEDISQLGLKIINQINERISENQSSFSGLPGSKEIVS